MLVEPESHRGFRLLSTEAFFFSLYRYPCVSVSDVSTRVTRSLQSSVVVDLLHSFLGGDLEPPP